MALELFQPVVARWFATRFGEATAPQRAGWRHIAAGRDTLIAAPTGSGKTLAAFLWAINRLIGAGAAEATPLLAGLRGEQTTGSESGDGLRVVYVSPLKALGNDVQKNLREPLDQMRHLAASMGLSLPEIRVVVRSGDTPAHERQAMLRRPPHILITTPESLYILLTAEGSRKMLRDAETVIVDEIHAVAGDKRGAHLALSLERLDRLAGRRLQRIGLSATQNPIGEIARLLVGTERVIVGGPPDCAIVDVGHRRTMDLRVAVMDHELGPIATHELYADIYESIAAHVRAHRTTIVFVNTRRLVERVAHQLEQRLGAGKVAAHHGSLSRETRLRAEEGLKSGAIPVVVATASLELGIDVGHVELVCHLGAPRALSTLLQRVGRAGHWLGAIPKGILFPLTRDDLVQCAAAVRAVRAGTLDRIALADTPLDILAQQIVATIASEGVGSVDEMWRLARRAYPFHNLERADFEAVVDVLSEGVATRRGRRSAHLHRDRVHGLLRARRGARLAAITSGGAIPDTADYDVIEEPAGTFVGRVNEDFAIESMAGDIFLLGNRSWRIRRVEAGRMRVEDAHGAPPTIPFWVGEAPARTAELSDAVATLREAVAAHLPDVAAATAWLVSECSVEPAAAEQIVEYIAATQAVLGVVPTQTMLVAERFYDESGGMQLVLHAPFGGRINRAWGLALRKRFCRTFDFELQAAATDDGIVLSLGEQHSFPLETVFAMLRSSTLEEDLTQAALAAPMFPTRWRWNASRALALLRHAGGKRVPMPIQRMRSEDLLAAVFPAQVACQDNHPTGPLEPPDHPLVTETIDNCLREAMDVDGLKAVLDAISRGAVRTSAIDTPAPSPMSHEILNANPYAFLDDAPLEERRARAVSLRRLDSELAGGAGALDAAAIAEVRAQAWPDVRDVEELHDLLLSVGILPAQLLARGGSLSNSPPFADTVPEVSHAIQTAPAGNEHGRSLAAAPDQQSTNKTWADFAAQLISDRRATLAHWSSGAALVAAERLPLVMSAVADAVLEPPLTPIAGSAVVEPETAVRSMIQGWMECLGPATVLGLAGLLGLSVSMIEIALAQLETEGVVLRGRFTSTNSDKLQVSSFKPDGVADDTRSGLELDACRLKLPTEWCDRRLLARIHRTTIGRLRREIEPVSVADFVRFLLRWQHVSPGTQLHGRDGIAGIIGQLQGIELPAPAWERDVLTARIGHYDPADLEHLCLAGVVSWGRLRAVGRGADPVDADLESSNGGRGRRRVAPTRAVPLAFVLRESLPTLLEPLLPEVDPTPDLSPAAHDVLSQLQRSGAAFLTDLARATGRLPAETEEALWELVARGLVTGDGIAGLRTLLLPESKRRPSLRRLHAVRGSRSRRLMPVGRWALLRAPEGSAPPDDNPDELMARQLLQRYGVMVRELLAREVRAPSWRVLLGIYRRWEARGEIRGGRFIGGLVGEQFALPEAVESLRAVRRAPKDRVPVLVAAADPLNLVGILTPGPRVSPCSNHVIVYEDGIPIDVAELGAALSRLQHRHTHEPSAAV